ncbi:MAG: four helix bundle protein [Proteobacteria bacterium]|nr:four helix bundle protein [Pseudomonadota bacterium]
MQRMFDHEKLNVYHASIRFVTWLHNILESIPKKHAVHNQLDRASTSISLNIAEGNGKSSKRDRCRFFEIARGSALECAAALDVLVAKGILKEQETIEGKQILKDVVSMLVGLIKSQLPGKISESQVFYGEEQDQEQEQE